MCFGVLQQQIVKHPMPNNHPDVVCESSKLSEGFCATDSRALSSKEDFDRDALHIGMDKKVVYLNV